MAASSETHSTRSTCFTNTVGRKRKVDVLPSLVTNMFSGHLLLIKDKGCDTLSCEGSATTGWTFCSCQDSPPTLDIQKLILVKRRQKGFYISTEYSHQVAPLEERLRCSFLRLLLPTAKSENKLMWQTQLASIPEWYEAQVRLRSEAFQGDKRREYNCDHFVVFPPLHCFLRAYCDSSKLLHSRAWQQNRVYSWCSIVKTLNLKVWTLFCTISHIKIGQFPFFQHVIGSTENCRKL